MKKRRVSILKILLVSALLPVLLFGFIQTPPGKALLARGLSAVLSSAEHVEVRIGTISGWIPGKVSVSEISVADAQGVWISGRNLHCRWMIRELLDERARFRKLSADEIVWYRFPKLGTRTEEERRQAAGSDFFELRLDGLAIRSLKLEKGVAGMPLNYAVESGGIKYLTTGQLTGELTVNGDAEGVIGLEAMMGRDEPGYLKIMADVSKMSKPTFGMDYLSGEGEALINADGVSALVTLELDHRGQQGWLSSRLRFRDRMLSLQQIQYNSPDYSLMGDASLTFTNGAVGVALDSTFIDVQTNRYDLRGTARVASGAGQWEVDLEGVEIRGWEAVSLSLSGRMNAEEVVLSGTLAEMDVGKLPLAGSSNFTGKVNGAITVGGSLEQPEVGAALSITGLTSIQDALDELPELDFRIHGGLSRGELFAETTITNYAKGHFDADIVMPCEFSFLPLKYKPYPHLTDARVDADVDLDILNQLAFFQNQLIRGVLVAEVAYEDRVPSGFLRLENGRYEHFDLGVVFRDIDFDVEASGEGFRIVRGKAAGSGSGSVELAGGFSRHGLGMNVGFSQAWILQRDEIEAQVSGSLDVQGSLFRPDVSGHLTINRAEILLDNMVRPPPPVLSGYERIVETNEVASAVYIPRASPVGLDVRVDLPEQIFVNAAMIEAVLSGQLHVVDTPEGVSVRGEIEPRRGFVNFVGKKFRFTEGEIVLDGSIPNVATLDNLTAEYSRRDVVARLVLNGPANDPRFRLESVPARELLIDHAHLIERLRRFNKEDVSPGASVRLGPAECLI